MPLDKNKSKEQSHRKRNLLIWVTALCLLIVSFSVLILLNLSWTQKKVIHAFLNRVENAAAVTIKVESYDWSPLSRLSATSVQVKSGRKEFLKCDRVELDYRLSWKWPYLIPTVLFLDRPVLHLERDSHGRWHIPREVTPEGTDVERSGSKAPAEKSFLAANFPLPELQVKSGRIIGFEGEVIVLSMQNITGTIPYQVTEEERGPILKIVVGQWSNGIGLD